MTTTARRVTASDGVSLAVYESGAPGRPTVVAVHGYPDNHAVWDGIAALLGHDLRVVTYDVRGAGESDKPSAVHAYRMPQLVDDLLAVLDAVSPASPVHLLAHDWGSIQSWPALTDDRFAGRIASFTSISGPSLDYSGRWLRHFHRHPRASLRQLAHSYYIALFQLPRVPEQVIRRGLLDRALAATGTKGTVTETPPRSTADKINGLALYRANMVGHLRRPRPVAADLPVQLIVPERDAFVTPELATEAPRPWVPDLTVRRLPAGHWVISERPELVARLVREFIGASAAV
jgi:pimeloyl-ACP methyl ester carboxylesterase